MKNLMKTLAITLLVATSSSFAGTQLNDTNTVNEIDLKEINGPFQDGVTCPPIWENWGLCKDV